jgi:hypothetical protein
MRHKRTLLKTVLLAASFAGRMATAELQLGPVAAWSWANLPHDQAYEMVAYDTDSKLGAGVRLEIGLGKHTALLLEPMFLEKGAKGTATLSFSSGLGAQETLETQVHLKYLELPILLRYSFTHSTVRPYVVGGATLGYLLSARVRTQIAGGSEVQDLTSELRRVDAGLVLALGASVEWGPARCFVEGRFVQGLVNLDKSGETNLLNQSIGIVAGVTFHLSGTAPTK